jgi:hypothetical protein
MWLSVYPVAILMEKFKLIDFFFYRVWISLILKGGGGVNNGDINIHLKFVSNLTH